MHYSDAAAMTEHVFHVLGCLIMTMSVMGGIGFGGAWIAEKRLDPTRY